MAQPKSLERDLAAAVQTGGLSLDRVPEGVWIEIIRYMEQMYAGLVDMQQEAERRAHELREAKEFADNVIRCMVNTLVVTDQAGEIRLVNEAAAKLCGYGEKELVGQPLAMLLPCEEGDCGTGRRTLWQTLCDQGSIWDREAVLRDKSGNEIPVGISARLLTDHVGDAVGMVLVVSDLRQIRSLQEQLIQSEKMSSLGRMAAGVAHEINNPLVGVVVHSHLMLENMGAGDPNRENVQRVVKEAMRCRDIVRDLLGFARRGPSGGALIDVNRVLEETLALIEKQPSMHNVTLDWSLSEGLPLVTGDAGQLEQAFMNIVVNAAQAMDGRGVLHLDTRWDADRQVIEVAITDTGPGIAPAVLPQLFEPFFTTKEPGGGTGLGLAIAYSIVERHHGRVDAHNVPEGGARFSITLPRAEDRHE